MFKRDPKIYPSMNNSRTVLEKRHYAPILTIGDLIYSNQGLNMSMWFGQCLYFQNGPNE